MELFNIGIPELLLILLVMLVVLGPAEMSSGARKMARWLRRMSQTETWRMMRDTTDELRALPGQLMREAGLEELQEQIGAVPRSTLPGSNPRRPPLAPPPPPVEAPPSEPLEEPPQNNS